MMNKLYILFRFLLFLLLVQMCCKLNLYLFYSTIRLYDKYYHFVQTT